MIFPRHLITLFFFALLFSANGQGPVTMYSSSTNCSTWNCSPCDGTVTVWVAGAQAPYLFGFSLQAGSPGGAVLQDTIVADTIITFTGLCSGSYWIDVVWDTTILLNPNNIPYPYPSSCTNCSGASGIGSGGGGVGGSVGAPLPTLSAVGNVACAPTCGLGTGSYSVTISGQAPPFQVNFGQGWTSNTTKTFTCLPSTWPLPTVSVRDATGQVITINTPVSCEPCGIAAMFNPIPTINVCAGQTIGSVNFNNYVSFGPNPIPSSTQYVWTNNNTATGIPANGMGSFPSFIAANVSTTQTSTITAYVNANISSNIYVPDICIGAYTQFNVIVHPRPAVNAGNDVAVCQGSPVVLSGSGANSYVWNQGVQNGVPFVPAGTATYTVTGTGTNLCTNTDQVVVTVKPLPTVFIGNDTTICLGDSIQISGSGANTYTWSNGLSTGGYFVPAAIGTYTLSAVGTLNGCQGTDSRVVTVVGNTIDAGLDTLICQGSDVVLSANSGQNLSWSNGVVNGVPFTPPQGQTTYYLSGTDSFGCPRTDSVQVTVMPPPPINAGPDLVICDNDSINLNGAGGVSYVWSNGVQNGGSFVPPIDTTNYIVSGTDSYGCIGIDSVQVVALPLPNIDAGSDVVICVNDSVVLNGTGGLSYVWSNTVQDGVSFVPPIDTTVYIVSGTDGNGCVGIDSVEVVAKPLPMTDAGTDPTLCSGDSIQLLGSGANMYAWSNGFSNGDYFLPPGLGIYSLSVVGTENGCVASDTLVITVVGNEINAGLDTVICSGNELVLTGSNGQNFTWSNGVVNGVPFTPPLGQTIYHLSGMDNFGCPRSDSVVVNTLPLPNIDAGSDVVICVNDSVVLNGTGGLSYVWSNAVQDGVSFVPPIGTTDYIVAGTDSNGCINVDTVQVVALSLPTIDAGMDTSICSGDSIFLSGAGGISYQWQNGSANNSFYVPIDDEVIVVTGIDVNGCASNDSITIFLFPLPAVFAGNDVVVCETDWVILNATGASNYTWNPSVQNGIGFMLPAGEYNYSVIGTDSNGCQNSDTVNILVQDIPTVSFAANTLEGCSPLEVTFYNTTGVDMDSCTWIFDGINTQTGCDSMSHIFNSTGWHTVELQVITTGGCENQSDVINMIYIEPDPIAAFAFSPGEITELESDVAFINNSTGAIAYVWDFGDGSPTVSTANPNYSYVVHSEIGFEVQLIAFSALGCTDTAYATLPVTEDLIFYVPNAFTPDGNEFNQVFLPVFTSGFDPFDYQLQIFNRWGELIFESNDPAVGWDGSYLGSRAMDGTYSWKISFKTARTDERKSLVGHVNVLK